MRMGQERAARVTVVRLLTVGADAPMQALLLRCRVLPAGVCAQPAARVSRLSVRLQGVEGCGSGAVCPCLLLIH